MAKGYILLHRQIWDDEIWKSKEPFDLRSAWIDLLMMANHADNESVKGKSVITIKRGQLLTSYDHLAKRWRWSKGKVRRTIELMVKLNMVHADSTTNGTTLTLVNYDVFQNQRHTNGITNSTTNGTTNDTTNGTLTNNVIKNNINNVRSNINNYSQSHSQTADDINRLFEKMRKEGKL